MSDTQALLSRIAALRSRLDQAAGLAGEARSAASALMEQVAAGAVHDAELDASLRPATGAVATAGPRTPTALTARARRVLERGGDLLGQLRALSDEFPYQEGEAISPLGACYRETVSMIDTALRTVALLPESATAQMHLRAGLEATLEVVAGRLRLLDDGAARKRQEGDTVARLAGLLGRLAGGQPVEGEAFRDLADELLSEAAECRPLRFLAGPPTRPAYFVACHSLTVARVAARVARHDPRLRQRENDIVLAALLHDVGMATLPPELLAHSGTLDAEGRRLLESHCRRGAELVASLMPDAPWLADAAEHHHERHDGQGYPDGLRDGHIETLTGFLAVCDVYAACCATRAHRPARPTRTALADTLLMAEEGKLDARSAECLVHLSFYPVGSVVELAHGAVAVVVATPVTGHLQAPARPVIALVTDASGEPLPRPHHLDLARCEGYSIVRTLSAGERRDLFRRLPEWAA